jgi:hypothetical protein
VKELGANCPAATQTNRASSMRDPHFCFLGHYYVLSYDAVAPLRERGFHVRRRGRPAGMAQRRPARGSGLDEPIGRP